MNYLIREPKVIDEKTKMIIYLHGVGESENFVYRFLPVVSHDWIVVSFQAPFKLGEEKFAWFSTFEKEPLKVKRVEIKKTNEDLWSNILKIRKYYGIKTKCNFIGFDEGGVLGFGLALRNPDYFHRVAILSACPVEEVTEHVGKNKSLKDLQFFISHGMYDDLIPLEWARKAAPFLYEHEIEFTFREYIAKHEINKKNYLDLVDFFSKEDGF